MSYKGKIILDKEKINKFVYRISHQIIEKNPEVDKLAIVGIRSRGAPLAERIVKNIKEFTKKEVFLGTLDITLYRDDLTTVAEQPIVHKTEIGFDVTKKVVVLVDDVLYTGRTVRCAMDALIDFGRPEKIQLAVLVDRGHREFPIRPDYVGKNLPTSKKELVHVQLKEIDGQDRVTLEEKRKTDAR